MRQRCRDGAIGGKRNVPLNRRQFLNKINIWTTLRHHESRQPQYGGLFAAPSANIRFLSLRKSGYFISSNGSPELNCCTLTSQSSTAHLLLKVIEVTVNNE